MSDTTDIEVPTGLHIEDAPTDPPEQRERPLSPREQIMQAAVAKAHQRMERDLELGEEYHRDAQAAGLTFPEEGDEPPAPEPAPRREPEPVIAAPLVAPAPAPVAAAPSPAPAAHTPAPDTTRTIVIDGQHVRVTDEQYANLAQLGMIANIALHQQPQSPPPAAPEPPARRALVDDARAKEAIRAIQFSDVDAAVPHLTALIEDVMARAPQPAAPQHIDQAALEQRATQAALGYIKFQAEQAAVRDEFPDIFANPQLTKLAAINVDALRANYQRLGVSRSDLDIYREAGHAVYDALGRPRPGSDVAPIQPAPQAAPAIAPRSEVIERKRAAPRNTQTVDRRAAPAEAPRAPTGSEIVDRMRQQRGQSSLR